MKENLVRASLAVFPARAVFDDLTGAIKFQLAAAEQSFFEFFPTPLDSRFCSRQRNIELFGQLFLG
jgi:hypothetical protein